MSVFGPVFGPGANDRYAGVSNPGGKLYILGDEDTDGSIRFIFDTLGNVAAIERREDATWNDTQLRVAASSLGIGWDTLLSSAGGWLLTTVTSQMNSGTDLALIPHVLFDRNSGTDQLLTPFLEENEAFLVNAAQTAFT